MRHLKKTISLVLILCMAATYLPATFAISEAMNDLVIPPASPFSDVPEGMWYTPVIRYMSTLGIVSGVGGGQFSPDGTTTRAQLLTVICNTFGIEPIEGGDNFIDAYDSDGQERWYTPYLAAGKQHGVVAGVGDNRYAPEAAVTYQEMYTMLHNALIVLDMLPEGRDGKNFDSFSDTEDIATWAREQTKDLVERGVVADSGNRINPTTQAQRAQMTLLLMNTYLRLFPSVDNDNDELSDYEELFIYKTDPFNPDTDGDDALDGWEVYYGFDPLVYNASFSATLSAGVPSEHSPVTASVTVTLGGDQLESLDITPVSVVDNHFLSPMIPGYLGTAYDFTVEGSFDSAEMTFHYDTSLGQLGANFTPRIYYYNEDTGDLEELPNQRVENGRVTAIVRHFSQYILLNGYEFDLVWQVDIRPPQTDPNEPDVPIDLMFVIDESNSMENNKYSTNNDPNRIRVSAAKKFTEALRPYDRAGVVGFTSDAITYLPLEHDMDVVRTHIDLIRGNRGGTQIHTGIKKALDELESNSWVGRRKMIIVLTDGVDDPSVSATVYDNLIDRANSPYTDVTIYTIGLGRDLDEVLLRSIANRTGGRYFYAETADSVYQGFDVIRSDTIDYTFDSNGDGISDYYSRLIFEGKLRLQNGSAQFVGIDFTNLPADADGDGIRNGDEFIVVEQGDRVFLYMKSNPLLKDSDFDGIPDNFDPEPMRPNFYNERDILSLTDGTYQYQRAAREYDIGNAFWDAVVSAFSFSDLQKEYTTQMSEFFINTATAETVDDLTLNNFKRFAIADLWNSIGTAVGITEDIITGVVDVADSFAFVDATLTETGITIIEHMSYVEMIVESNTIIAYQEWFMWRVTDVRMTSLEIEVTEVDTSFLGGIGKALKVAKLVIDSANLVGDIYGHFQTVNKIAELNSSNEMFKQNIDIVNALCNSGRGFTRSAAQFVRGIMIDSYTEAYRQLGITIGIQFTNVTLGLMGVFAANPYVLAAKITFDLCNAIFGWSRNAEIRARVLCQSDIAGVVIVFVRRYYATDDQANLRRCLINLVSSHIQGETQYLRLNNNDATAQSNITTVKATANRMNLFTP
ncbi:MAG: S-layer homology domain-containing protein [Oscillospiraceae bacterium]|nr:S-layer homology domain-containing protein [Oscillospiraceae bacterium]